MKARKQSRILVDSNSYFRLAQTIHPLLGKEFGNERYCLYIIDGFNREYFKNSVLQNKFGWVEQQDYVDNRKQKVRRTQAEKEDIKYNLEYMYETAKEMGLSTSYVDVEALAICLVLEIPIATDDSDMLTLANEYDINSYKTLELLKLMLDREHVTQKIIDSIVSYWDYLPDRPKNMRKDYESIFEKDFPQTS